MKRAYTLTLREHVNQRGYNLPTMCGSCGYDLRGLQALALCPECGVDPLQQKTRIKKRWIALGILAAWTAAGAIICIPQLMNGTMVLG